MMQSKQKTANKQPEERKNDHHHDTLNILQLRSSPLNDTSMSLNLTSLSGASLLINDSLHASGYQFQVSNFVYAS